MSTEFDDLVKDDEEDSKEHEPKKSTDETGESSNSQSSIDPLKSETQHQDVNSQSVENQAEKIADSTPMSWDREQFAMFFKETDVFGYEDLMHDAEGQLKRSHRVRNTKRYELDQAFIDLVLERVNPEEIAAQVIENRGFKPEDNG